MVDQIGILFQLLLYDLVVGIAGFPTLHRLVRRCVLSANAPPEGDHEKICAAVSKACSWYPRRTLCLQRSAVLTCVLRRHGIPAELVIGVSPMPFRAHAWVEVQGAVVNDKASVHDRFMVMERC